MVAQPKLIDVCGILGIKQMILQSGVAITIGYVFFFIGLKNRKEGYFVFQHGNMVMKFVERCHTSLQCITLRLQCLHLYQQQGIICCYILQICSSLALFGKEGLDSCLHLTYICPQGLFLQFERFEVGIALFLIVFELSQCIVLDFL